VPARGSLFQRTEILVFLLAFPLLTAGCGPRLIWGTPEQELRSELASGQYSALAQVDFSTQEPSQALALSPSAPFYLSFVFDSLDKPDESLRMLDTAWRRSPSPWKEEAGLLLARRYIERKSYDQALVIARQISLGSAPPAEQQKARRLAVEALYWTKQDAAVLKEADLLASTDAEVLLFRAVSSMRLDLPQARDLTLQLFLHEPVSSLHSRVYTFVAAEPAYLQLFGVQDQDLLAGKDALAQGDWSHGIPLVEGVARDIDPGLITDGTLVTDLGNSYVNAGQAAAGARFMEALAARLTGQARTDAEEQVGRLYRRAREYGRAMPWLRSAAADADNPAQRDRARWQILDVLFATAPDDLPARVAAEAPSWNDPSFFSDLLHSRIAELIGARKWRTLLGLWLSLDASGPPEVRAQLSYVIAREWQEGAMPRLPGGPPEVTARALFQDAERRDPAGYYGILASSMLGDLPDRAVPAASSELAADAPPLDPVVTGFLQFGLASQAYSRLWALRDALSEAQLLEAARQFARAGDYRSSMYFMGAVARTRRLTFPELQAYYPRAYVEVIEPLASDLGVPDHLVYGLVREESYFDPRVVSSAGAVGLAQLMPSTAASVAQKLHLVEPDLRDPATNLAIGLRHFRDLVRTAGSTTKALLAYNAGLSRLRRWERSSPGLPADLFVESAAIAETRDYVKKILVSSVMYAFLYKDADPREAALSFFSLTPKPLRP
jgi:soluble lytic murein transglycosylase-like protein/thioredoxin-like negative regulator of GroEL